MNKLKIGVWGMGDRGYSFAIPLLKPEYLEKTQVVAVCDTNELKREFGARTFGAGTKIFADANEFLKCDMDLVIITTPQFAHADCAVAALNAGFNVFLEKPMARNTDECRRIIEAEKRSGKTVFMGFNLRHHPVAGKMIELIQAGKIGKTQQISCTDFYSGGYSYFRRWHRLSSNSGGLAVEKGCHSIDLINKYAQGTPIRVAAFGGLNRFLPDKDGAMYCSECGKTATCPYYMDIKKAEEIATRNTGIEAIVVNGGKKMDLCVFNSDKDTFDNHLIIIEYDNGCRASLGECFTSSVSATSGRQFVVNGWDGQLWAYLTKRELKFYPNNPLGESTCEDIPLVTGKGNHGGADGLMLDYVIDCITNGKPNDKMLTRDGFYAVAVAEAAEKAVLEKRIVDVAQL